MSVWALELPGADQGEVVGLEAVVGFEVVHPFAEDGQSAIGEFGSPEEAGAEAECFRAEAAEDGTVAAVVADLLVPIAAQATASVSVTNWLPVKSR